MKRYIIFTISFIALFFACQILSGYVATLLYTPDVTSAWNQAGNLSSHVIMKGSSFIIPLSIVFIAATMAYIISKKSIIEK